MLKKAILFVTLVLCVSGCGGLETKSSMINVGDDKASVMSAMGAPDDRQMKGQSEAWQYCQTGAGFGYHDFRIIWFYGGKVTGVNSYKSTQPGTSCMSAMREIRWEDAPDVTVEVRER